MWPSKITISLYYLSFVLYNILLITPSLSSELCNPNDKATLFQIKQSFGNPYHLASWTNQTDCCHWYSVECDRTNHRDLTFRKLPDLIGQIPVEITKLKNLKSLRLDSNNLSGPIPSFLSRLKKLHSLDLSFNKFSGSVPLSLALFPNLYEMDLSRNQLSGTIPKSFFSSFKLNNVTIDLSHNQLSGRVPTSLGNVYEIYLSRNQLTGDASAWFRNRNTRLIDLSRNKLKFNLSSVEFGLGLEDIDLNHNKIYGSIPPSLAGLTQLQYFNVSYNQLCGRLPTGGQLAQFDQYSFFHNRCLCGAPLTPC
ncbi:Polygalacturonase inhibitor [Bienertia sinuspersici]